MYNAGMSKTAILNCRIDPAVKKRAEAVAKAERTSLSSLVEFLLDQYASRFERHAFADGLRKGDIGPEAFKPYAAQLAESPLVKKLAGSQKAKRK